MRVVTIRTKRAGWFRIIEKCYAGNTSLPVHQHETPYVSFLLSGRYLELCQNEERECPSGTVIWHPRTESHSDKFQNIGAHIVDVEINPRWLEDTAQELKPLSKARIFSGGLPYAIGLQMYRQLRDASDVVEDLVTELLSFFFTGRLDSQPPAWFVRAVGICNDVQDQRLTLTDLAVIVGVHPVHVARSFRRFLGCTFGEHRAKIRIRNAFGLLLHSQASIADVACACGFADHAHLCRAFKQATGFTPSAFRELAPPSLTSAQDPSRLIQFKH